MSKNKLTERIGNTVKAGALAAAVAMPNVANSALVTDITNFYNPNGNNGKIVFNIFDDTGLNVSGATLVDFYGGDLLKSDVTSYTGDVVHFPFGNFETLNDNNNDNILSGELSYNNVLNNSSLNMSGIASITYGNGLGGINSTYNVNNVAQTPLPSSALLFGSAILAGLGLSKRKSNPLDNSN